MNLWDKIKTMADGAKNLTLWVGSGGEVVSQELAQERADICLTCADNRPGMDITREVAEATLKFLSFKNELELRVNGEDDLQSCRGCGCVIPLMIWESQDRIQAQMTREEIAKTPNYCWKLRKP